MGGFLGLGGSSGGFDSGFKDMTRTGLRGQQQSIMDFINQWNPGRQNAMWQNSYNRNVAAQKAAGNGMSRQTAGLGALAAGRAAAGSMVNAWGNFYGAVPGLWAGMNNAYAQNAQTFYKPPTQGLFGTLGSMVGMASGLGWQPFAPHKKTTA